MNSNDQSSKDNAKKCNTDGEVTKHREAAAHLESAVKYHFDAARHYENGDNDQAKQCNTKAQACTEQAISKIAK